ncbi:MAG: hypothetical protein ACOH1T_07955 [Microbacteriaceae bacterium]
MSDNHADESEPELGTTNYWANAALIAAFVSLASLFVLQFIFSVVIALAALCSAAFAQSWVEDRGYEGRAQIIWAIIVSLVAGTVAGYGIFLCQLGPGCGPGMK